MRKYLAPTQTPEFQAALFQDAEASISGEKNIFLDLVCLLLFLTLCKNSNRAFKHLGQAQTADLRPRI